MRVGLITNYNGKGLQLDADLLSDFLRELGHEPVPVQFDQPCDDHFDLAISLEVVNEHFFSLAPKHIWIPNLEWTKNDYLLHARKFDRIWAKTSDSENVLRGKYPHVTYTGFLSRDRRDTSIPRERRFLHVGGDSGLKNTNAVIAAWRQWKYWTGELDVPLTVISRSIQTDVVNTDGITFLKEVTDDELRVLQNSHLFHLQPSAYEGWGHAIRESQSVGAVLLTTRAGPMAELHAPFEVEPTGERKVYMATAYNVSGREIREKVGVMLEQPSQMIAKYQVDMRGNWEQEYRESKRRMEKALVEVMRSGTVTSSSVTPGGVNVAILGNLRPEFSTENEWAKAFRSLGCKVSTFQEDEDKPEDILSQCLEKDINLFLYVHTHSFKSPGTLSPLAMVESLRENGIKTVSPHLDLYFGLNTGDQRDAKVGRHAFFKTDYVMTADGSDESAKKFRDRGVNHIWMQPGVAAEACVDGESQKEYLADVGFAGAIDYHQEYSFRAEMVQALRETYGDRFRVFQGHRGKDLNNVFASCKIFVGDCCFAGRPRYWSDRLPESCGRGAFLLHPQVEGTCIPTATYRPQDIQDLIDKIEYFLSHEDERELIREAAQMHVREHDTYVHRAQFILKVAGI